MTATTFPAALATLLRADAGRPLVTFYDDATGERIELSVATYANWVAKTAGLAQDELDAERGGLVLVDLPTHWLGAVWLGAAWSLGLAVTDDPALADDADLVVCGPDGVPTYAAHADRVPVVALSLRPLGGRFTEELPPGVTDYGAVVLAQPDAFVAYDPPEAGPTPRGGRRSRVRRPRPTCSRRRRRPAPWSRAAGSLTDVNPSHAGRAADPARTAARGRRRRLGPAPRRERLGPARRPGARHRPPPSAVAQPARSKRDIPFENSVRVPKPVAVPGSSHRVPVEAARTSRSCRRSPLTSPTDSIQS